MSTASSWRQLPEGFADDCLEGDRVVLLSAGIDIGSSTMHMTVSRLVAERDTGAFAIVHREVLHESPIEFTPYRGQEQIDADAVMMSFEEHYRRAGVAPSDIDTGVVILTGVALDRANAEGIGKVLSAWGGQFLSVAAGDRLEGFLAAQGSGAVARSRDVGCVINVDIGGGTIKVATCWDGRVERVQAFDVGTRLISWDPQTRIVQRLEPSGRRLASELGIHVQEGAALPPESVDELVDGAADALVALLEGETNGLLGDAARTGQPSPLPRPSLVMFSGGAAEYLQGEDRDFGDLGRPLAAALAERFDAISAPVAQADSGIRATAIGAGQFTVQVSGVTIHRSPAVSLPLRNLPVVALPDDALSAEALTSQQVAERVRERLALLDDVHREVAALALPWRGSATVTRIESVAEGVASGRADHLVSQPLVVVCHGDVARLLGRELQARLGPDHPVLVIDGIELVDLDFVDIGEPLEGPGAIPVTIKSLAFRPAGKQLG